MNHSITLTDICKHHEYQTTKLGSGYCDNVLSICCKCLFLSHLFINADITLQEEDEGVYILIQQTQLAE